MLLQFIESVEAKYHQQAEEAGVFVVSACGFDSIPQDMGVKFTEDNFPGKYLYCMYAISKYIYTCYLQLVW